MSEDVCDATEDVTDEKKPKSWYSRVKRACTPCAKNHIACDDGINKKTSLLNTHKLSQLIYLLQLVLVNVVSNGNVQINVKIKFRNVEEGEESWMSLQRQRTKES